MAVTVCMASASVATWYYQKQLKNNKVDTVEQIDAFVEQDKTQV